VQTSLDHDETLKPESRECHMMLATLIYRPSRVLAACGLLALSGCASEALNNQLAASREAVDQAKIVGAAEAVPADYDAAVDKLNRATTAANERHKDEAMRLAQEAQVDANLARARTNAAQARIAAAEMAKSNDVLRETIARVNQNQ
jgi:hypothetical protein